MRTRALMLFASLCACTEPNPTPPLGDSASDAGSGDGQLCVKTAYYLDGDGDSYGDPARKQEACIQPAGYVANNLDCDDADPAARPGQIAFFNVPTKGTQSFDFNCDKLEQMQDALLVNCVAVGMGCQGDGWVGSIPACGQAGTFGKCNKQGGGGPGCGLATSSKLQSCH
jgi:hypothetical protein